MVSSGADFVLLKNLVATAKLAEIAEAAAFVMRPIPAIRLIGSPDMAVAAKVKRVDTSRKIKASPARRSLRVSRADLPLARLLISEIPFGVAV